METTIKNSKTIVDAYCEQQSKMKLLEDKAKKCSDMDIELIDAIRNTHKILQEVLKGFHSERVPLGIFFHTERYSDELGEKINWTTDRKKTESNAWYWPELCLNTTGSSSIILINFSLFLSKSTPISSFASLVAASMENSPNSILPPGFPQSLPYLFLFSSFLRMSRIFEKS